MARLVMPGRGLLVAYVSAIVLALPLCALCLPCAAAPAPSPERPKPMVLREDALRGYVDAFNADDDERYAQYVPNSRAFEFLRRNIPRFECPDKELERTYYFRWWTYRKHLRETPDGFVVTEFLPDVPWAGKHNTISCAAGHHLYEGRWLRDPRYLDDYSRFWFHKGGDPRRYSFWAADAIWARALADGRTGLAKELLPDLIANYRAWEQTHLDRMGDCGLFWQVDDRDGMEVAIGGTGYRATINSYLYGDAQAIAAIADLAGKPDVAREFRAMAGSLRELVLKNLWDEQARFFKVGRRQERSAASGAIPLADVREEHGFTPWYFHLPPPGYEDAWKQLLDPKGFLAPFGPTTAEQRHPGYKVVYQGHECQWNGPSWPYATAVTLTAMANVLNDYRQEVVGKKDYLQVLCTYALSHRLKRDDGRAVCWIDENLNPQTGDWISRTMLRARGQTNERGKDYNHSTFCDLVITGLVGLRPRVDDTVVVNPLVPEGAWNWFCLDGVPYHGRSLTILWDRDGRHYGKGAGLRVLADGKQIALGKRLGRVTGVLGKRDA